MNFGHKVITTGRKVFGYITESDTLFINKCCNPDDIWLLNDKWPYGHGYIIKMFNLAEHFIKDLNLSDESKILLSKLIIYHNTLIDVAEHSRNKTVHLCAQSALIGSLEDKEICSDYIYAGIANLISHDLSFSDTTTPEETKLVMSIFLDIYLIAVPQNIIELMKTKTYQEGTLEWTNILLERKHLFFNTNIQFCKQYEVKIRDELESIKKIALRLNKLK